MKIKTEYMEVSGMFKELNEINALPVVIILLVVCISSMALGIVYGHPILMTLCIPIMMILSLVIPEKWYGPYGDLK